MPLTGRSRGRRQPCLPVLLTMPATGVGQLPLADELSSVFIATACAALGMFAPLPEPDSFRPTSAPPAHSSTAALTPAVQRSRLEYFQPVFGCSGPWLPGWPGGAYWMVSSCPYGDGPPCG